MDRTASAVWNGDLKAGKGTISTHSGVLKDAQYSFKTRFEDGIGTNPEELIAAAHAGCFSMAFANELAKAGHVATSVATTATVTLEMLPTGPTVTKIHLSNRSTVPGIDKAKFDEVAAGAKANCPISRLLAAATITLDATLE
jgi:osmotically inducible protein OsmC